MDTGQKRSRFENETPTDLKRPRHNGYDQNRPSSNHGMLQTTPNNSNRSNGKLSFINPGSVSKVLHVRNLPFETTEQELMGLGSRFGRVENVLVLKSKNQGFLEMADVESAANLFNFHLNNPASIRGRYVYFQYSNRDEITSPPSSSSNMPQQNDSNSILLVTIMNCFFPITIEIIHQVFSKYGRILKIVIFSKNGNSLQGPEPAMQSLIQFNTVREAVTAKVGLDGQNIYNGCCTLHIQFSSLTNLNVRHNNQKGRDFTQPYASTNTYNTPFTPDLTMWPNSYLPSPHPTGYPPSPYPPSFPVAPPTATLSTNPPPISGPSVLIVSNLDSRVEPDALFTLFGVYGDVQRVKILYNKPDTALIQFVNSQHCMVAHEHLNNAPLFGKNISVNFSKHTCVALPRQGSNEQNDIQENKLTKDYSGSPLHRFRVANSKNYQHICPPSQVLHVSNMSPNSTEEDLGELFSHYGTVSAVKFFPGKSNDPKIKDNKMALVEMSTLEEAITALIYCHNFKLNDGPTNIRVSFTQRRITPNFNSKRRERSEEASTETNNQTTNSSEEILEKPKTTTEENHFENH